MPCGYVLSKMKKKKIVIADDHTILREGLRALISDYPDLEVVGEAADGFAAIDTVIQLEPDLLLLDLTMPKMNGLEAVKDIKKIVPQIKIIVLTIHESEELVLSCIDAGVDGYTLKQTSQQVLLKAIRTVLSGNKYIDPEISARFEERKKNNFDRNLSSWDSLTNREKQIVKLLVEGHTNRQIGDLLFISPKTVDNHRTNLMKKLNVHNIQQLTTYYLRREQGFD